jgi:hypothetical protein
MGEAEAQGEAPKVDGFGRDTRSHEEQMAEYLDHLRNGDEKELRDTKQVWPKTMEEVSQILDTLTTREHDYGTCVYAMSHGAVAAYNYVAHCLGVTGFQASCADLDIIRLNRHWNNGFRLTNFADLLFPQYMVRRSFPMLEDLLADQREALETEAKKKLEKGGAMHPNVREHLEWLAAGQPLGDYSGRLMQEYMDSTPEPEE